MADLVGQIEHGNVVLNTDRQRLHQCLYTKLLSTPLLQARVVSELLRKPLAPKLLISRDSFRYGGQGGEIQLGPGGPWSFVSDDRLDFGVVWVKGGR